MNVFLIHVVKAASSSKAQRAGLQVLTPAGKIDAEEAAHRGVRQINGCIIITCTCTSIQALNFM